MSFGTIFRTKPRFRYTERTELPPIADPDAAIWDEAVLEQNKRHDEWLARQRDTPRVPDKIVRVVLRSKPVVSPEDFAYKQEQDRKRKKTKPVRLSPLEVPTAQYVGLQNAICNHPLCFDGQNRRDRASDCPITSDGEAPDVLTVQLVALVTAEAVTLAKNFEVAGFCVNDSGSSTEDGYVRVYYESKKHLLQRLGRSSNNQSSNDALDSAIGFLSRATVRRNDKIKQILRRVPEEKSRGFWLEVSPQWLKLQRDGGTTYIDLALLLKQREPIHLNALVFLRAWAGLTSPKTTGERGGGKRCSLANVARCFGLRAGASPIEWAKEVVRQVERVAVETGTPFRVEVVEGRDKRLVVRWFQSVY